MPVESPAASPPRVASYSETALLAALVVAAMAFSWARSAHTTSGVDFFTKWSVARAISESGGKDVYSAEARRRIGAALALEFRLPATGDRQRATTAAVLTANQGEMEVVGSPFLYASMAVFGLEDFETSYVLFALVSLLSLAGTIVLLGRHLSVPFTWTLVLLSIVAVHFEPLRSDAAVGNINQLQLAAVVGASLLVSPGRRLAASAAAGALLGIATMLKLNVLLSPAFLLIGLWLDGRRRSAGAFLAGLVGSALAAFVASAAFFGDRGCWLAWREALPSLLAARYGLDIGNFGLAALIYQLTGLDVSKAILATLLLSFAYALWRSRRRIPGVPVEAGAGRDSLLLGGLGCGFMILSGPYVLFHYFVLAIPLAAAVSFRPDRGIARVAGPVAFGLLLVSTTLVSATVPGALAAQAILLNLAVIVLVGLGLRALAQGPQPPESHAGS